MHDPTRRENTLEIILSSRPHAVNNVEISDPIGNSDHNFVKFINEVSPVQKIWKNKYRSYKDGRYTEFREYISKVNWHDSFSGKKKHGRTVAQLQNLIADKK